MIAACCGCYYSLFLLFEGGDASAYLFLHFGVGSADVFVVGGGAFEDVGFGVGADAGGAEADVALFWVGGEVHREQKLEMSSLGCKSQKVRLKSIIFQ